MRPEKAPFFAKFSFISTKLPNSSQSTWRALTLSVYRPALECRTILSRAPTRACRRWASALTWALFEFHFIFNSIFRKIISKSLNHSAKRVQLFSGRVFQPYERKVNAFFYTIWRFVNLPSPLWFSFMSWDAPKLTLEGSTIKSEG